MLLQEIIALNRGKNSRYGIDGLKRLIKATDRLIDDIGGALQDGKVSAFEALGLIPTGINLFKTLSEFPVIQQELNDLDEAESAALVDYLLQLFPNLENQQAARAKLETLTQMLGCASELFSLILAYRNLKK